MLSKRKYIRLTTNWQYVFTRLLCCSSTSDFPASCAVVAHRPLPARGGAAAQLGGGAGRLGQPGSRCLDRKSRHNTRVAAARSPSDRPRRQQRSERRQRQWQVRPATVSVHCPAMLVSSHARRLSARRSAEQHIFRISRSHTSPLLQGPAPALRSKPRNSSPRCSGHIRYCFIFAASKLCGAAGWSPCSRTRWTGTRRRWWARCRCSRSTATRPARRRGAGCRSSLREAIALLMLPSSGDVIRSGITASARSARATVRSTAVLTRQWTSSYSGSQPGLSTGRLTSKSGYTMPALTHHAFPTVLPA